MKTFCCVTSMSKNYYDHIGIHMIESWKNYWPSDSFLVVYAEGFMCEDTESVKFISWEKNCFEDWHEFYNKESGPASVFAKKGFAFLNAMNNYKLNAKKIIWLDADLLFKKEINLGLIDDLVPEDKLLGVFDQYFQINPNYTQTEYNNKDLRNSFGAESGFVILNTKHEMYDTYVKNYKDLYKGQKNSMLVCWYDSEIVILAAADFLNCVEDLSKLRTTNKTQTPLNRSILSDYMSHIKAKVKKNMNKKDFEEITNVRS